MNTLDAKLNVVPSVHTAPGHSQKNEISPGAAGCTYKKDILKPVKSVSCVIPLSYVNPVLNAPNVVTNLPVGARLQKFWKNWLDLGARPKVVQILKEGYTLPFRIRPNLSRTPTVISCYGNPHREPQTVRGFISAYGQKCHRTGPQKGLTRFLQPTIFSPETRKQVETDLRLKQSEFFPQDRKIQDGDTGNHQNISPKGRMGNLRRLQGRLLPHSNTGTVQEVSQISYPGADLPVQSTAVPSVNRSHGVHYYSKGGEADGYSQRYKDPPVPRRLVGESHIPPGLSPAYADPNKNVPTSRLAGECRKVGAETQADFQLRRLPIRPPVRSGSTDTGPVAKPSGQNTGSDLPTGLFGKGIYVPDRVTDSHRKTSSSGQTTHEAHSVASQKQLENTGIPGKTDPSSQIATPSFTMVAERRQCPHRPAITPSTTCSANLYRRIKRRVGRSLKRVHCQRNLVTTGKQTIYKLLGTKSSLSGSKRVPKPMHGQNGSDSNRQYHSSGLHQQGGKHEVGPTLCPTLENLDLVYRETSDSEGPTHSRPPKCSGRQTVQIGTDYSNRMVPPSRGFSSPVQEVAPASDRSLCYEIQQQGAPVRITSSGSHGHCSGRTCHGKTWTHTPSHRQPYWAKWWRSCRTPHTGG